MIYICIVLCILQAIEIYILLNLTTDIKKDNIKLRSQLRNNNNFINARENFQKLDDSIKEATTVLDNLYLSVYNIQYYLGVVFRKPLLEFREKKENAKRKIVVDGQDSSDNI